MERYEQHRHRAAVEAFLMLANHENIALKRILGDPRHPAYLVVSEILRGSSRVAIMRQVLNMLEAGSAPTLTLQVVSHRNDLPFIRQLLQRLANTSTDNLRRSLRRVDSINWLQNERSLLKALTGKEQEAAVQLVQAASIDRIVAFNAIKYIMRNGRVGGRRAASAAVAEFGGAEANKTGPGWAEGCRSSGPGECGRSVARTGDPRGDFPFDPAARQPTRSGAHGRPVVPERVQLQSILEIIRHDGRQYSSQYGSVGDAHRRHCQWPVGGKNSRREPEHDGSAV